MVVVEDDEAVGGPNACLVSSAMACDFSRFFSLVLGFGVGSL